MENEQQPKNDSSGLDKAVKISIIVGALLVAFSVAYYFIIFLPQKEKTTIQLQQKQSFQTMQNKSMLANCLNGAYTAYVNNWNDDCATQGLNSSCSLPLALSNAVNNTYENSKNTCFRQYPQN